MSSAPAELRIPSPLQKLDIPLAKAKNVDLYIKRDDLIHPFVSGNKWRKLQGYIHEAEKQRAVKLVSFGGSYSNHLLAVAAAGALLGYETMGYVRGEAPKEEGHILKLCRSLGMELIFIPGNEFSDIKREKSGFDNVSRNLYIPEGGYGREGLEGFISLREKIPFIPDHIITAVGTGTTLAGIAAAFNGTNTNIEGVVVLKGMQSLEGEIQHLFNDADVSKYVLHHDFHEGGYAKVNDKVRSFITAFAKETGVLTDPVYTAKMILATYSLLERDYFAPGCKIVCLHTGGIVGGLSLL